MKSKISNFVSRTITATIILVATFFILYFSDNPTFLRFIAAVFSCLATYEFFNVTDAMEYEVCFVVTMIAAVVFPFLEIPYYTYTIVLAVAFILACVVSVCMMVYKDRFHFAKPLSAAMLSIVVILFFKAIPELREMEKGLYYLICPILICIATDMAAYLVERKWGKTKLIPKVSPNKTVEGAVAGIIVSFLLALAYGLILRYAVGVVIKWKFYVQYAIFTSAIGQFGDLTASIIKRIANVKDYGVILPGHGGVLDRLDSHAFAFAFTYLYIVVGMGFII